MFVDSFKTNNNMSSSIPEDKIEAFKEYVKNHMPGMEYKECKDSYAVTRFVLKNTVPMYMNAYKNSRVTVALGSVLNNSNITTSVKGNEFRIDVTKEIRENLRLGDGLKILADKKKATASADFYIGERASGGSCIISLSNQNPHMILAGNTGSGKSVATHDILLSLASRYNADEINVYAIDPKGETFKGYFDNNKSIFKKSVISKKDAYSMLGELEDEFKRRQDIFNGLKTYCNGIEDYNNMVKPKDKLPLIILVVEELDALFVGSNEFEKEYAKKLKTVITAMAKEYRSQGLRLILISQRPNAKLVGTDLRDQCGIRLALKLEKEASRMLLGNTNATKLSTGGDGYIRLADDNDIRIKVALVERDEIIKAHDYIRKI